MLSYFYLFVKLYPPQPEKTLRPNIKDKKRKILNFLLQNCELKEKKLLYKLKAPFDTVLKVSRCSIGLALVHDLRTLGWSIAWQFPEVAFEDMRKLVSLS